VYQVEVASWVLLSSCFRGSYGLLLNCTGTDQMASTLGTLSNSRGIDITDWHSKL